MKTLKNTLCQLALLIFSPVLMFADWVLVADFEGDFSNMWWRLNPQVVGVAPEPQFVPDPVYPDNQVFYYHPGGYGVSWNEQFVAIPLPPEAVIPFGSKGTMYFRYYLSVRGFDANIGLTSVSIVPGSEGDLPFTVPEHMADNLMLSPGAYSHYEVQFNIAGSSASEDGTAVREPNPAGFHVLDYTTNLNEWIEHWIFVDNDAEEYEIYYRKPGMDEPVMGVSTHVDFAGQTRFMFRNLLEDDLTVFILNSIAGNPANPRPEGPTYIDDIYISLGDTPNLTAPVSYWAGFRVVDSWVDTGSWLGMVYVEHAPWVYVATANSWVLMDDEAVEDDGSWGYFPRP